MASFTDHMSGLPFSHCSPVSDHFVPLIPYLHPLLHSTADSQMPAVKRISKTLGLHLAFAICQSLMSAEARPLMFIHWPICWPASPSFYPPPVMESLPLTQQLRHPCPKCHLFSFKCPLVTPEFVTIKGHRPSGSVCDLQIACPSSATLRGIVSMEPASLLS